MSEGKEGTAVPRQVEFFPYQRFKINMFFLLCLPRISLAYTREDLCVGLRVRGKHIQKDGTSFFLCQCVTSVSLEKGDQTQKDSHHSQSSHACQINIEGKPWLVD